jgi:hypothetical protein
VRKTGIRLWDCPRKNPWLLPRQQHWCCSRASSLKTVSTPPCDSQHMKWGFAITLLNSTATLAFKACFDISAAWHSSQSMVRCTALSSVSDRFLHVIRLQFHLFSLE